MMQLLLGMILVHFLNPTLITDAPTKEKKVLVIGIDGCRADVFPACLVAKHLPRLIKEGAFSRKTDVLGERRTGALTVTGHGWACIFTGVWADKHGVKAMDYKKGRFKEFPTFFHRLRKIRPRSKSVAIVSWKPFADDLFKGVDCRLVADGDKIGYENSDRKVAQEAINVLQKEDPDAMFVYFGDVDIVGHGYGFHPKSPRYTAAVERVDEHIGKMLVALRKRPNYAREDWLVVVCTDHGGRGRDHMNGIDVPEIRTGFLILHGPAVKKQEIPGKRYIVDIAPTVLRHLGINAQEAWKLDGKVVGLK